MGWVTIAGLILDAGNLALGIKEAADKSTHEPESGLKAKPRWLQCTIKNETQFDILLDNTYFDSGRYYTAPGSLGPFGQMVFSCCNGDNTIMTGVSGGTSFHIPLDNQHSYYFAIGWTCPYVGTFKASVTESKNPRDGYDTATETGNSIDSKNGYTGKDEEGKDARIHFHLSASPGQEAMFVITEVRDS